MEYRVNQQVKIVNTQGHYFPLHSIVTIIKVNKLRDVSIYKVTGLRHDVVFEQTLVEKNFESLIKEDSLNQDLTFLLRKE